MKNKQETKKRIEKLKQVINYHRYLYHVLDKQEISENVLDSLKHELFLCEQKYPEFITSDSPTQRVGGTPLPKFKKVFHQKPMLSIEDVFDEKELSDWEVFLKRLATGESFNYFGEMKIDGFAISLIYKNGIFFQGSTRGDGKIGEDVTQNLKTIESIPLRLEIHKKSFIPSVVVENLKRLMEKGELEIRGEVYMEKNDFQKYNALRKEKNEQVYSNPRNLAAGSIRQLDPKLASQRPLKFLAYDLVANLGQTKHNQEHKILSALGFKTDAGKKCETLSEIMDYWQNIVKKREDFPFQIDGIVISVDDNFLFQKLGVAGKSPRGVRAFKFAAKQAVAQVLEVKFQIGRTGAITPIAILKPISIEGVTITRATLHNEDQIRRLGLKIGDTVVVERAGDVIPAIIKVLWEMRIGEEKEIFFPKNCPACQSKLFKPEGEVVQKCSNENCQARTREFLEHFVSKKGFDIEGLGPKIIDCLMDKNLISEPVDIFELKQGDLIPLERFAEKSAENLIKAIAEKKEISLAKFIYALGIFGVGEETSQFLAEHFFCLENLKKANLQELQNLKNIGPKTANSIYSFFLQKEKLDFIEELKDGGVKIINPVATNKAKKLQNKTFVFTGTLKSLPRETAKDKIRDLGGNVSESISSSADFLVIGEKPGSKLKKAQKLGIKIIEEKEFLNLLE
ncbi:NAD-dependent DNA ligase LigA [Patescibacteria group bacterium]|nr:NAD-dependent DNA ligase LigA [Patescibacteria group bacterium]